MRRRHPCILIAVLLLIPGCSSEDLGTVRNGRVEVVCRENVIAYASVVDNHTGDATTMLAKPVGW